MRTLLTWGLGPGAPGMAIMAISLVVSLLVLKLGIEALEWMGW